MISSIDHYVHHHNLLKPSIVIGLSGGPDSVFLLHYLAHCKHQGLIHNLVAAHLDHGWRENSHLDVEFCQQLAYQYRVRFVHQKLSDLALSLKFNGSQEEIGRRARRHFLEHVRKQESADVIALAHHTQDQQETFFIRLLRGASLSGLAAMRPHHSNYIRPLLETQKTDIVAFLNEHNIPYLTDPTNASDHYLRNRLRNHVIPALKVCDARFDAKFASSLKHLQATEEFLTALTSEQFALLTSHENGAFLIDTQKLVALHPVMQHRILVHWFCAENVQFPTSTAFFDETLRFLASPRGGTHSLHPSWKICKHRGTAFISR